MRSGITLIALILTIIIMLILAGVTISILSGNDGIIDKAEKAVSETEIAAAKEQAELMLAELSADYYEARYVSKESAVATQNIGDYIASKIGTQGIAIAGGNYVLKLDGENITVLTNEGTTILTGKFAQTGKVTWDQAVNDSNGSGDNNGENAGGDSTDDSGSSEIITSLVLADDYGHSYTVTEVGKYYFYSYTYGQNFMSVFDVTEGTNGLQSEKLGEYSLETGRKRADEDLHQPNDTFFDGMTCLSSEEELADTYNPNSSDGTILFSGWPGSILPHFMLYFRLSPGFYYHASDNGGGTEGFTTYIVDSNFDVSVYQDFTTELSSTNCETEIEQWVDLDELCLQSFSS